MTEIIEKHCSGLSVISASQKPNIDINFSCIMIVSYLKLYLELNQQVKKGSMISEDMFIELQVYLLYGERRCLYNQI